MIWGYDEEEEWDDEEEDYEVMRKTKEKRKNQGGVNGLVKNEKPFIKRRKVVVCTVALRVK